MIDATVRRLLRPLELVLMGGGCFWMEACDARRVTLLDYTTYFYFFIKATQNPFFKFFYRQHVKISGSFFCFPVCVFFFRQTSGGGSPLSFSSGEQAGGWRQSQANKAEKPSWMLLSLRWWHSAWAGLEDKEEGLIWVVFRGQIRNAFVYPGKAIQHLEKQSQQS